MIRRCLALTAVLAVAALVPLSATAEAPTAHAAKKRVHRILCLNKSGTHTYFRKRPRTCADFGPGGAFAGGVFLIHLRWRHFGHRSATARGRECGFHEPCENLRAKVRAYRLRNGCRGTRVYTRLRATTSIGSVTVKLPRCTGPA